LVASGQQKNRQITRDHISAQAFQDIETIQFEHVNVRSGQCRSWRKVTPNWAEKIVVQIVAISLSQPIRNYREVP
jgi:hypothetical protein